VCRSPARSLTSGAPVGVGYKPFLHGIARSRPRGRVGRLREDRRLPATLSVEQVAAILAAQTRLRDRFVFALLAGTGMQIGQALGLRHYDVVSQERRIEIVAREDNPTARGARAPGGADHRRAGQIALGLHARRVRGPGSPTSSPNWPLPTATNAAPADHDLHVRRPAQPEPASSLAFQLRLLGMGSSRR
jgi:hypothetical protein